MPIIGKDGCTPQHENAEAGSERFHLAPSDPW